MLKNLKISRKLALGFGTILLVLLVVAGFNYNSFNLIGNGIEVALSANENQAFLIEKEVDHLNWMAALSDLFLDDAVHTVTVQTDDHKCGLGEWLYSDETRKLAAADPELAGLLKKLEEPHARLHQTAVKIDENYINFDMTLQTLLAQRWIDHLDWIKSLSSSLLERRVFDGGVDPHQCGFGKWYYAYSSTDPEFRALLKEWEAPHNDLHESAAEIVTAQRQGDWNGARNIYEQQTLPALEELEIVYRKTDAWMVNSGEQQQKALAIFDQETTAAVEEVRGIIDELKAYYHEHAGGASDEVHAQMDTSILLMIVLSAIGIVIGIVAAFFITRGISKPIQRVVDATEAMNHEFAEMESAVEAIAANDLTREIPESQLEKIGLDSKDEVGVLVKAIESTLEAKDRMSISLRRMSANLNNMVRQLSDNARELVSAATEIASSSEQMSRGAQDQTQQVTQVSTAVEQMTATIVESSKNAGDASGAASNASETASTGGQVVSETITGMQQIADTVRHSAEAIAKLATSADQIGEIIGVIDDIADQTNLLALNAAIEAARAGEQGRGFAVVADEVRKLAERTGKATGEITEMIKGIQTDTSAAVEGMEAGIQQVDKGRELADQAGSSLGEIVSMSQRVMDMIQQIATASEEQSTAAEQISRNIEHIAGITRESASGAEQSAAAAEELNQQAESLRTMVSNFKIKGGNSGIVELAKQDHRLYVKKLHSTVKSPQNAEHWNFTTHQTCRFGKWYYSNAASELRGDAAFTGIENPHKRIHELANQAVDALKHGNEEAARALAEQAEEASHDVIARLEELAAHMNSTVNA